MGRVSPSCVAEYGAVGRAHPVPLTQRVWPAAQQVFAVAFALTLAWGVLTFPAYKRLWLGYVPVAVGLVAALTLARKPAAIRIEAALRRGSDRRFLVGVIVGAVAVRATAVICLADAPVSDHAHYDAFARQMLMGRGYGPTAYYPPGMSFWLLMVYTLFGYSLTAALLVNALVGGLFTWLTYAVARHLLAVPAARLAALMTAVFPSLVLYATTVGYDVLLGCALLTAVLLFVRRRPAGTQPWPYVAAVGATLGVATFLKPIGLLLPFLFGLAYWRRGASPRRALANTGILLTAMFVVLSPWTIRNYRLFGEVVPVTTSGGVGLWVTNHPGAGPMTTALPDAVAAMPEVERSRVLGERARDYLWNHPEHLLSLAPAKAAYQWGTSSTVMSVVSADRWAPPAEALAKAVINTAWTALCAFVVLALLREGACRHAALFWPLIALLAYLWGIHQVFEAQSRYHLPFLPVMFVLAATAMLRGQTAGDATE
jgi:4-amino-4-deoxy-L-arabinose transferase-like glycosyltransferase